MSTIIVYTTNYGTTEKCARIIADKIGGDTQLVRLGSNEVPCLHCAQNIIIGGSIYAGRVQSALKKFIAKNIDVLIQKKVGLFLCAAENNEPHRTQQIENAFDKRLREHAVIIETAGYQIDYDKLSMIHKIITKLVSKQSESQSALDMDALDRIADCFKG